MGLSARGRALPCRASRRARMRGVRRRAAGPPDDLESGGGDEQPHLRCKRGDKNAAGFCQGQPAALQISARDKIHRRITEDRHRQDRPPGGVEDVGPVPDVASLIRATLLPPSLRANGSRECAPDDKLREAIQKSEYDGKWIASSLRSLQ